MAHEAEKKELVVCSSTLHDRFTHIDGDAANVLAYSWLYLGIRGENEV